MKIPAVKKRVNQKNINCKLQCHQILLFSLPRILEFSSISNSLGIVPLLTTLMPSAFKRKNPEVIRMKNAKVLQKGCNKERRYMVCDKGHELMFI